MKNNRRKTVDLWQEEMNRVEMDRRIMLITAYLNEIQEFPESPLPKAEAKELLLQTPIAA
jgi:hypothetical protein